MTLRLKMLTEDQMQQFHEASLKLLRETGMRFFRQEAIDLLEKHGSSVNGNLVRIPDRLVEASLKSCPRQFTWKGFNDQQSVEVRHEPLISPAVGPVFIQDIEKGRRMATREDYANVIKLMHALDIVSINGGMPVDIAELPSEERYIYMMACMLRHTDKPILGFCLNQQLVRQTLDFYAAVSGGEEIWDRGHYLAAVCTTLSPLAMDEDTIDTIFEYAKRNQIVMAAACVMAGISGPINPLGTAVLQNAEILASIVLAQCVRPGSPVIYSVASTAGYMKDASFGGGSPDAMMIHGPCIQTAMDLYDLPIRTMTGINSAKEADYQAGMETGMSALLSGLIGGGVWPQSMGVIDDIMTLSYEKLILDADTLSRALHVRKGLDFSQENLSVDAITEVGPQGNFLMHPQTFQNFSQLWTPEYMSWESREVWQKNGGKTLQEKAHEAFNKILEESPASLLSTEQDKQVSDAMERFALTPVS